MSHLAAVAVVLGADPSPNPTEGTMRPGLETWEVSPGLIGFLFTFAIAVACVLLFLSMSKHLRKTSHNARQQGLPIAEPEGIGFRRTDDDAAGLNSTAAGSDSAPGSTDSVSASTDSLSGSTNGPGGKPVA